MSRILMMRDFEWIPANPGNKMGYFSFKTGYYEICLEREYDIWIVYLCNIHEEVLEEIKCPTKATALNKANDIYVSFAAGYILQ